MVLDMGLCLRLKVVCNLGKRVKSVGKMRTHVGDSAEYDTNVTKISGVACPLSHAHACILLTCLSLTEVILVCLGQINHHSFFFTLFQCFDLSEEMLEAREVVDVDIALDEVPEKHYVPEEVGKKINLL